MIDGLIMVKSFELFILTVGMLIVVELIVAFTIIHLLDVFINWLNKFKRNR